MIQYHTYHQDLKDSENYIDDVGVPGNLQDRPLREAVKVPTVHRTFEGPTDDGATQNPDLVRMYVEHPLLQ